MKLYFFVTYTQGRFLAIFESKLAVVLASVEFN